MTPMMSGADDRHQDHPRAQMVTGWGRERRIDSLEEEEVREESNQLQQRRRNKRRRNADADRERRNRDDSGSRGEIAKLIKRRAGRGVRHISHSMIVLQLHTVAGDGSVTEARGR